MYSVIDYGRMSDPHRFNAYHSALARVISKDSVVVDLGAGTGIFALLAAKLGARKVYAIEPDPALALARVVARANSLSAQIEFIQKFSTEVELPEKADVIVADLKGALPMYRGSISSVMDARDRFLKPGGILIPQKDRIFVAVVQNEEFYRGRFDGYLRARHTGVDWSEAIRMVNHHCGPGRFGAGDLLSKPEAWADIDYTAVSLDCFEREVDLFVQDPGTAHGLGMWFDSLVWGDIQLTNAPEAPPLPYGKMFFPLPEPVVVEKGDRVRCRLSSRLVGDDYLWQWETEWLNGDGSVRRRFSQSNLQGNPIDMDRLKRLAPGGRPRLGENGTAALFVLEAFQGEDSIREISVRLLDRFPGQFASLDRALSFVQEMAKMFAR